MLRNLKPIGVTFKPAIMAPAEMKIIAIANEIFI
jgi:hypothetical protein